jgi:predicted RNA methylase
VPSTLALPGIDVSQVGDDLDFWSTPRWAVEAVLPLLPQGERWALLEPAAGHGAILDAALPHLDVAGVWAVELHDGRFAELEAKHRVWSLHHGDFFLMQRLHECFRRESRARKLALFNPPYSKPRETIGREFVEKAIELCQPDGFVATLLPLAFATGDDRCKHIHSKHRSCQHPFRTRPKFGGEGSGSRDFAWFLFDLAHPRSEWWPIG